MIYRLFESELLADNIAQECLSQWESRGKSLPTRTVVVEGRKVGDRVIAIMQPAEAKPASRQPAKDSVLSEQRPFEANALGPWRK